MPASCGLSLVLDRVADAAQAERAQRVALALCRRRCASGRWVICTLAHDAVEASSARGAVGAPRRLPSLALGSLGRGRAPGRSVMPRSSATSLGRAQRLEAGDRRLDEVDRVLRAEALGEDVVDARELEHGAHAAAGDDAGTGGGGLEHHAGRRRRRPIDLVGDRRAVRGTWKRFFFARSTPFWIATGTSLALP